MEKIIKFIDENYHSEISLSSLEEISYYSKRNIQRLFKLFYGETISQFQNRLKLENGLKKIVYTSDSISKIAQDIGYSETTSFNKAFKKLYEISPKIARQNRRILFNKYIFENKNNLEKISFDLLFMPAIEVYYKLILTNDYDLTPIDSLWNQIDEEIQDKKNIQYYGLIVDHPLLSLKNKSRYEACINKLPDQGTYLKKNIFGKKYLKFKHEGSYESIDDTYRKIYFNWINDINYELDNSPIIEHYIINSDLNHEKENSTTEIYFPVK